MGRERHDVWQLHRVFLVASVAVVVEAFADFESKNEKDLEDEVNVGDFL